MRRRFLLLSSMICVLYVLAACDGGGSGADGGSDAASGSQDASADAPVARDAGDTDAADADVGDDCDSDRDCVGAGLLCDRESARCVACLLDADCDDGEACTSGRCEQYTPCTNSLGCIDAPEDLVICDRELGRCVQCVAAADCEPDEDCQEHACVHVERCDDSLACDSGQVCEPESSRCVDCVESADCESSEVCSASHVCRKACDSDNDCTPDGQLCDRAAGHCTVPVVGERGTVRDVSFDTLDLLFVVDDSGSMKEEQAALRVQFPRLIQVLTTGDRDLDGEPDFPAMTDVHLAVVSTDLGIGSATGVSSCSVAGEDGVMSTAPAFGTAGCAPSHPSFLRYDATSDDADQVAEELGCAATLGTEGCGFEQQLEAGLKALWPSTGSGITFLGDTQGQGDGPNAGFLRNDPDAGLSLIGVIVVTDEEDCSTSDTHIFTGPADLAPGDPLQGHPMNMRCYYNKSVLYGVERYVDGFRSLRAGLEELVTFGAIVGVPPDLVTDARRAATDLANASSRDAFYDAILNDPRMVETIDPATTADPAATNLTPSCFTTTGRAFPPRRIVEVARSFGENGVVASICEDDFTSAMDAIIGAIVRRR